MGLIRRAIRLRSMSQVLFPSPPAGINCGSDCSEPYTQGTSVTLSYAPASGSSFTQWSGCDSINGGGQCVVSITGAKTVNAVFTQNIATASIKANGKDEETVLYLGNPTLTWASTNTISSSCNITTDKQLSGFPKNGQSTS